MSYFNWRLENQPNDNTPTIEGPNIQFENSQCWNCCNNYKYMYPIHNASNFAYFNWCLENPPNDNTPTDNLPNIQIQNSAGTVAATTNTQIPPMSLALPYFNWFIDSQLNDNTPTDHLPNIQIEIS
jgi:hypothetical protein